MEERIKSTSEPDPVDEIVMGSFMFMMRPQPAQRKAPDLLLVDETPQGLTAGQSGVTVVAIPDYRNYGSVDIF